MNDLTVLVTDALAMINTADDVQALEQARVQYLGKKSQLTELSKGLGQLDAEAHVLHFKYSTVKALLLG